MSSIEMWQWVDGKIEWTFLLFAKITSHAINIERRRRLSKSVQKRDTSEKVRSLTSITRVIMSTLSTLICSTELHWSGNRLCELLFVSLPSVSIGFCFLDWSCIVMEWDINKRWVFVFATTRQVICRQTTKLQISNRRHPSRITRDRLSSDPKERHPDRRELLRTLCSVLWSII